MDVNEIKVFLSCSSRQQDKPINELVQTICRGIGINCINVARGYEELPPEKAREYINESSALLAIVSRRDTLSETDFAMPAAVREEIAMAYFGNKPLRLIIEEGVRMDGFVQNYGTALQFRKPDILTMDFIYKITATLYELRMQLDRRLDEVYEFYTEYSNYVSELRGRGPEDFIWAQSVTKKLCFTQPCKRPLKVNCWATLSMQIPENANSIEIELYYENGSKPFTLEKTITRQTPSVVDMSITINPQPSENDYIVYTTRFKSKYLMPIYAEDIRSPSILTIHDQKFDCFDGFVPIQPTRWLKAQYRFPREYGLSKDTVQFFVGSYTTTVDHIVETEIKRAKLKADAFGGDLVFDLEVESPWLRHMYGIAWNVPSKG